MSSFWSSALVIKHSRTKQRQPFFSRRVVSKRKNLTENIISAESLTSFKNRLDEYDRNNGLVYKYKWDKNVNQIICIPSQRPTGGGLFLAPPPVFN